jgi:hypothetical protein
MATATIIVQRVEDQGNRVLLWGKDPDYHVIADAGCTVKVGDTIEYELYGFNFGWHIPEPDYDAHIAAKEKAHNEVLDQAEEDRAERNPDTGHLWGENHDGAVNLDSEHDNSRADLIFNEREFLLEMVDNPLPALFEKHLKPRAAEAFEMFKREGFVLLSFSDDRYRITNKGRLRLGLEADPKL